MRWRQNFDKNNAPHAAWRADSANIAKLLACDEKEQDSHLGKSHAGANASKRCAHDKNGC